MRDYLVGLVAVWLVLLSAGLSFAAEPIRVSDLLDDPQRYANKQVTISGMVTNVDEIADDPLSDYAWTYTVQDTSGGTITVKTKGSPPRSRERVTVSGVLEQSGGEIVLLQGGGVPPFVLVGALVVLVGLAILLVFLIVRKPTRGPAAVTVAAGPGGGAPGSGPGAPASRPAAQPQEFCEQCGKEKPVGQPCPHCGAGATRTAEARAAKPSTVEVKPESEATQLIETAPVLAWLAIREGDRVGKRFDVTKKGESVGRAADNTVSLDDNTVSRHHAKILFEDGKFLVHDLGSSNKTKVNGVEVVRQELEDGDEVEFGSVKMVFKRA